MFVELAQISKRFGDVHVLRDVNLRIEAGELCVLLGSSGSGKSTLLRIIAGLEQPTSGAVTIGGRDVTHVPASERGISMVFQNYALYPHMTVAENMGFALRLANMPATERKAKVDEAAAMLGLDALLGRYPKELSGGQRQRVAIGRAIVRSPKVFLFDEPLSNLDAALRTRTRLELKRIHQRLGTTSVYVTHDQVEAMSLGNKICILKDGRVEQLAPPAEIFAKPASRFVAEFIGQPRMNLLPVEPTAGGARHPGTGEVFPTAAAPARPALLGLRPQELRLAPHDPTRGPTWVLDVVEELGTSKLVHGRLGHNPSGDAPELTVELLAGDAPAGLEAGSRWRLDTQHTPHHFFDAQTERRL